MLHTLVPLHGRRLEALDGVSALTFDWNALSRRARRDFLEALFSDWDGREAFGGLVHCEPEFTWTSEVITPFGLLGVDETTRRWRFKGGDNAPQFHTLLLLDCKSGQVLGFDVDGTAVMVDKPKKVAKSLAALELREHAPDEVAKGAAHQKVFRALNAVTSNLFQLKCCTSKTKEKEYAAKCNKALETLEKTIVSTPEFAEHEEISKLPKRYAGLVKALRWESKTIKVAQREARFFEDGRPVEEFDGWMEG